MPRTSLSGLDDSRARGGHLAAALDRIAWRRPSIGPSSSRAPLQGSSPFAQPGYRPARIPRSHTASSRHPPPARLSHVNAPGPHCARPSRRNVNAEPSITGHCHPVIAPVFPPQVMAVAPWRVCRTRSCRTTAVPPVLWSITATRPFRRFGASAAPARRPESGFRKGVGADQIPRQTAPGPRRRPTRAGPAVAAVPPWNPPDRPLECRGPSASFQPAARSLSAWPEPPAHAADRRCGRLPSPQRLLAWGRTPLGPIQPSAMPCLPEPPSTVRF